MKTYTLELLPDEPIILMVTTPDYSAERDQYQAAEEALAILDSVDEPLFNVIDHSQTVITYRDMITGINFAAAESAIWQHPMVKEVIIVSQQSEGKTIIQMLGRLILYRTKAKIFPTLEKALAYCRSA